VCSTRFVNSCSWASEVDVETYSDHLSDTELKHLRKLVGSKISWIHGSRFLVAQDIVVSPFLCFDGGREFLVVQSERRETPVENLDHYRLKIVWSTCADARTLQRPILLETVSSFSIMDPSPVASVSVFCTRFEGDSEAVDYDSWIVIRLEDGREYSIGHAPPVYSGVCVRIGGPPEPDSGDTLERRRLLHAQLDHAAGNDKSG